MPAFSLQDVRALAVLAREAGALIMRIRAEHDEAINDIGMVAKDDGSPVSRADHLAQEHVLAGLQRLSLDAPVVAEELASQIHVEGLPGFYLIDPLDGTKAFLAGGDDFTVNIGYTEKGAPVMGVMHVPALNETYYSADGTAYFMNAAGAEETIRARAPNPKAYDVIVNRTEDWSGRLKRYLENYAVGELHRRSSAHKLALVAHGKFDLYPRFGRTCEWDIAAGDAILRAAGGMVETLEGAPMIYGKPDFYNPPFIARGASA